MPYTPTRLYQGQISTVEVTASPGILTGAVGASTTWIVKEILVCNTSTNTTATLGLSIVPSAGTGGSTNRIISGMVVKGAQTISFGLSTVMSTGDFISAVASSAVLTVTISGVVIT